MEAGKNKQEKMDNNNVVVLLSSYQQRLLHIDVIVQVVQTLASKNGYYDAGNYGNGSCQQHSLPLGPLDVQEALGAWKCGV